MIKRNIKRLILTSIIMLIPMVVGLLLWNRLPELVPSHWGIDGQVDSWSSKAFAVFGFPGLLLEIYPAGDKAVNIAKCVYIFHRVGEVPNGKIVHAEKKTAEIDPAEQGQYRLPYTVNYFAFTTEDGEAYYMYFSGNNIVSFFRGEFGQGEECIFAFVY